MSFTDRLNALCRERRSNVCIGLDPVWDRLPDAVRNEVDPIFAFNRAIIDATIDVAPVYKPNLAFYEALGLSGWTSLKKTIDYIDGRAIVLGDAKRGDIDNTARAYAQAMFDALGVDACTISIYPGLDAAQPFLDRPDKGVFILCRTSNPSAPMLQDVQVNGRPLYEYVARMALTWNANRNCGLVVGATYPRELADVRSIAGDLPFLIPGIGAQGGDLEASVNAARGGPFIINSSRGIIYADKGPKFADAARSAAIDLRDQIETLVMATA